ncbi:MAG: NUDIX domain-containing protein [Clostridia bacterium]|nr:NUDIX domain-containing protein [Clostridia bacterium]
MWDKAKKLRSLLGKELVLIPGGERTAVRLPDGTKIDAFRGPAGETTLVGYAEYRDGRVKAILGNAEEKADQATLAERIGGEEMSRITRVTALYETSTGAVVFRTGADGEREYLLIRERKGHAGFPKGHREPGETPAENALREIREETGLQVILFPGFRRETSYLVDGSIRKSVLYFLGKAGDEEPVPQPEEVESIAFYPFREARARITFPRDREILTEAEEYLEARKAAKEKNASKNLK